MEKQGLHIDFKVAKQAFESYLDEYDREDDKIQLKIVHTYCVVDAAEEIATRMHLREEDVQLAKIIGLLHDIGRFEQIKRFHSFEPGTMDHAMYGADLLFGPEQMIRRFVTDPSFDQLICVAIAKHSDFKLEGIEDKRTLLHARLISARIRHNHKNKKDSGRKPHIPKGVGVLQGRRICPLRRSKNRNGLLDVVSCFVLRH